MPPHPLRGLLHDAPHAVRHRLGVVLPGPVERIGRVEQRVLLNFLCLSLPIPYIQEGPVNSTHGKVNLKGQGKIEYKVRIDIIQRNKPVRNEKGLEQSKIYSEHILDVFFIYTSVGGYIKCCSLN